MLFYIRKQHWQVDIRIVQIMQLNNIRAKLIYPSQQLVSLNDSPDARQREVRGRCDDAEACDAGSADPPGGEERPYRLSKLLCTGSSRRHHRPGAVQPRAEDPRNVQFQAGSPAVSLRRQAGVPDLRPKADPAAQRCAGE